MSRATFQDKTDSGTPTGATTEVKAQDINELKDKVNNPGLTATHSVSILSNDEIFVKQNNQSGVRNYVKDASVQSDIGIGNGYHELFVSDGSAVNFSDDFKGTSDTITIGNLYRLVAIWDGQVFSYALQDLGPAAALPVTFSNFRIEAANPDRVLFDASSVWTGSTFAGFTLANPSKTITAISGSGTSSGYFTVSAPYVAGDQSATIAYDGTDDITSAGGDLAVFGATNIDNNIGLIQLTAPTLDTLTPGDTQMQLDFTNPNSGNEDENQVQYKLDTEPTVWTNGITVATSGVTGIQTGLTNDLLYDFRIIAKGDGVTYSDSNPSNILSDTPTIGFSPEAQAVFDLMTGLTTGEKNAMAPFIDAQVANGNWALMDEFWCHKLVTESNSLIGWKGRKNCINNGATHGANGFTFDGVDDYLDTQYHPATDGVNVTVNNCMLGNYLHSISVSGVDTLMGLIDAGNLQYYATTNYSGRINSGPGSGGWGSVAGDQVLASTRYDASNQEHFIDGVSQLDESFAATAFPNTGTDRYVYIGAVRSAESIVNYLQGTIGASIISAAVGFNQSAFNTDLRTMLAAL